MKKVKLNLPVSNLYNQGPLKISQQLTPVELELTAGEHLFTSNQIEIGSYLQHKVFAHVSIPYHYDAEMQYVTIAGPDDISDKQFSLHTSLDKQSEISEIHRLNNTGAPKISNNLWSDFIDKNIDVKQAKKIAILQSIDTLVKELLDAGVQGVIQTGSAPVITPSNYNDYKAIFNPEKPDKVEPSLTDISDLQFALESTYGGTITWALDYSFANVIGSTDDPKPSGSRNWIKLWADKCNDGDGASICSSHNYSDGGTPFPCLSSDFVGGHVIPGKTAREPKIGSSVYIFPICKAHNNNDNIYMSMRYNPKGIVLKNFLQ